MPRSDDRRLFGFGLAIESDRDVPGALLDRSPGKGSPDLRIATLPPFAPAESPPLYRWEDGALTFSAPGVGRYSCRHDAIEVAPIPRADPDMVTALLIATALPASLWLRGGTMLHAAGIVSPSGGSALALAGPSGIGKSALTAELLDQGGALLADDSICLRRCGDRIEGSGLPSGCHLHGGGEDARNFHPVPADRSVRTATIGAVMIMARTTGAPTLIRLTPVAAVEKLLANLHRPAVSAVAGRRAETLATMAFIAGNCAVYDWHRSGVALGTAERDMLAHEGLW